MPADELGSTYSSKPVRFSQAIKPVGKEMDREQQKKTGSDEEETLEREHDSVNLSSGEKLPQKVTINENLAEDDDLIPGSHIDLTIG
ncbi:MAG: hypothetical protein U9Q77_01390 [Candidatus Marinimicrobia bacterium]|nr:hypothetical protein [Candidatus Neomarinimicrobiota bacterium]